MMLMAAAVGKPVPDALMVQICTVCSGDSDTSASAQRTGICCQRGACRPWPAVSPFPVTVMLGWLHARPHCASRVWNCHLHSVWGQPRGGTRWHSGAWRDHPVCWCVSPWGLSSSTGFVLLCFSGAVNSDILGSLMCPHCVTTWSQVVSEAEAINFPGLGLELVSSSLPENENWVQEGSMSLGQ